jgi:hypothetical protein
MKPLTANLKHFYQSWQAYLGYLCLGLLAVCFFGDPRLQRDAAILPALFLFGAFLLGFFVSVVMLDVMRRPIAFVLPGHRRIVRVTLLGIGGVGSLPLALLFCFYAATVAPDAMLREGGWVLAAATSVAMAFYLTGATIMGLALLASPARNLFLILPLAAGGFLLAENALFDRPVACVVAGLAVSITEATWLSSRRFARRICGRRPGRAGNASDGGTQRASAPYGGLGFLERAVLPRLARSRPASLAWTFWGESYAALSLHRRFRPVYVAMAFVFVFAMLVFMGGIDGAYREMAREEASKGPQWGDLLRRSAEHLRLAPFFRAGTIVIFPCLLVTTALSPLFSTLPRAAGRRERFRREMASSAIFGLGGATAVILVVVLCRLLFPRIPLFMVPEAAKSLFALPIQPPGLSVLSGFWAVFPLFLMVRLTTANPKKMAAISVVVLSLLCVAGDGIARTAPLPASSVVALILGGWTLYAALAWRTAAKRNLVG